MPKGQKLIDWTAENDARLILTIIAVENLHPNCENVAAAFGGSVNAMAISNRLSRLRKKAADEGLMPKGGASAPAKGRKANGAGGAGKKGKGGKKGGMVAEESDDDSPASDFEGSDSPPTRKTAAKGQKVLTGRVTKVRNSGTKNVKSIGKFSDDVEAEVGDNVLDGAGGAGGEEGDEDGEDADAVIKSEDVD